jgi:hypothetical protein
MLMKKLAVAVVAALGFAAANAMAYAEWKEIDTDQAPPASRSEVTPPAREGYTRVPGYWDYRAGAYAWSPGRFEQNREGYTFAPPKFERADNGRYRMYAGGWEKRADVEEHGGTRNKIREAKNKVNDRIKNGDKDD